MTEQTQKTYSTILRNHRNKEIIIFDNQILLCTLWPSQEKTIRAVNPWQYFARYESVTWNKDGSVDLVGRDDFREPARGKYVLKCLNVDGKDHEPFMLGGLPYNLPRGIPVLVAVEITDPLVVFQSLELKYVENWVPDPGWQGYLRPAGALEAVKTERAAEELAEINQELEELAKKESQAPADTTKEI